MSTNKVAQVTAWFWVLKICATTLGETAGRLGVHDTESGLRCELTAIARGFLRAADAV